MQVGLLNNFQTKNMIIFLNMASDDFNFIEK